MNHWKRETHYHQGPINTGTPPGSRRGFLFFLITSIRKDVAVKIYSNDTLNGQGRTETRRNVLPQYALFHVQYRLNKQPKKK